MEQTNLFLLTVLANILRTFPAQAGKPIKQEGSYILNLECGLVNSLLENTVRNCCF
jgi:hypothetical protein